MFKYYLLFTTIISSIHLSLSTSIHDENYQMKLFRKISKDSWRETNITNQSKNEKDSIDVAKDETLDKFLIQSIMLSNNLCYQGKQLTDNKSMNLSEEKQIRFNLIIERLPLSINGKNFWDKKAFNSKYSNREVFLGEKNSQEVHFHNNPRNQLKILDSRELLRVGKEITDAGLFDNSNFPNDDTIRALSLCGTFCYSDNGKLSPIFSGMLIKDQSFKEVTYKIHSCLHGFQGNLADIYFLPYGITANIGTKANLENCFQVDRIYRNKDLSRQVTQEVINNTTADDFYAQDDYATVIIKGLAGNNRNLLKVLTDRQSNNVFNKNNLFPDFPLEEDGKLPTFSGMLKEYDERFKEFKLSDEFQLQQYIIIGRPGYPAFGFDDSGFAIVTNLTNYESINPTRSFSDDPDLLVPRQTGKQNQITFYYPSMPGMSGGIILQLILVKLNDKWSRICRPFATVWGSERKYENYTLNQLASYGNIII